MNQPVPTSKAVVASPASRTFPSIWTLPRAIHLDWAYAATDKRDLRIDLLRGFAVFAMVANHFGGASWLYLVTGGNTFFVSAAEAFIFISGLTVGMVYGAIALKEGLRAAQVKALKRAFTLYKLAVALTLIFASISLLFKLPWAGDLEVGDPLVFLFNVVALRQTMYLTDIPLMYTFLMLAAPVGLWLLFKRRTGWLLAGSTALWLTFQLAPAQAQVPWPIIGNTTFNLAAWQL
ncbi:MAG: OpgC domain-containing protein, partial [Chloroflexota bacterium]|nr:OpgC domain-containing protein [Chloroflexota bacterium]